MKSRATAFLAVFVCAVLATGCAGSGGKSKIGVALAAVDDGYVASARRALEAENSGKARLSVLDGQNQASVQSKQIDALLTDKADALIVNPIDSSLIDVISEKAKQAGVPVVFFGRSLPADPLKIWEQAYFVGGKAAEAEALQVEIVTDYWKAHPEADKNKDGKLEYIAIRGDSHKASAVEAEAAREKAFAAAGIPAVQLAEVDGGWTRSTTQSRLAASLATLGHWKLEAVLCGSDEMALGAVEALRMAKMLKSGDENTPVIGVDGTRFAIDAIGEGSLLGTVRCDAASQGRATALLAAALASKADPASTGLILADGRYVYIPYQKVTKDNYKSVQ
jgi:ABC-type sugar transport system, periplasmic component